MDAGFDVWLGNNRGTRFSLKHRWLDAVNDAEYWKFGWGEQGLYDQPANIRKILEVTGYEQVAYVGHSLGNTQMFYGLAMEQDNYLSDHVSVFIALGPCTKFTNTKLGIID